MKKFFCILMFFICFQSVFSQVISKQQLLPAGHWVYEALDYVSNECALLSFVDSVPASINEIQKSLTNVEPEKLSPYGKELYSQLNDYLNSTPLHLDLQGMKVFANMSIAPELYYKSNQNIEWDYRYAYKNRFATLPVIISYDDLICIESDLMFAKNYAGMQRSDNFMNIPFKGEHMEFLFPTYAYFSTGHVFDGWGINFSMGKQGYNVGRTLTGSLIYNQVFETDFYSQVLLYNKYFKYSLDLAQCSFRKLMYLHELSFRPFKNFTFKFMEGVMVRDNFELRYLNPFMIIHQFSAKGDYGRRDPENAKIYGQADCGSYLGIMAEYVPVKNLRTYLLFAQNELQLGSERSTPYGNSFPNSIGFQWGAEFNKALSDHNSLTFMAEGIWTSPFLYLKQHEDWSLSSARHDERIGDRNPIRSWIGTEYGPDCAGFQLGVKFKDSGKTTLEFDYGFTAHGENDFSVYDKVDSEGHQIYYPLTIYIQGCKNNNEFQQELAQKIANNMGLTGVAELANKFTLKGEYIFTRYFSVYGRGIFSMYSNCNHQQGNFQQGFELTLGGKFTLF